MSTWACNKDGHQFTFLRQERTPHGYTESTYDVFFCQKCGEYLRKLYRDERGVVQK